MNKKDAEKPTYTKQQFLSSSKYKGQRDLLNTLLQDGKSYTFDQVNKLIEDFLKKEVK